MADNTCEMDFPPDIRERAETLVESVQPGLQDMSMEEIQHYIHTLQVDRAELDLKIQMLMDTCKKNELMADEALSLLENSPDVIARFGHNLNIIYVNPAFERLTGINREDALGHLLDEIDFQQFNIKIWETGIRKVLESGRETQIEFQYDGETETLRYYHSRIVPETSKNERPESVLVIAIDITELVKVREELRESVEQLRITSDLITDYSYSFKLESDGWLSVEWVSGAFEDITGYTPEEANIKGDWIKIVHPDDQHINAERLKILSEGKEHRVRLRIVGKDGTIHWMQDNARPITNEGRVVRIIGATADITDLKNVEEELLRRNFLLESFNYSASHDLQAPLRSLDGYSKLLQEEYSDKLDEQAQNYISRIRANAQYMAKLIDGLLQLSRTERKKLYFTDVDLSRHVRSISKTLRESDPDREVEFIIQEGIRAGGDDNLIEQLLQNLLGNAWKFTKNVENARIEFGETHEESGRIFFVRDNGVGFDMKYSDDLFTPFRRLHAAKEYPGTGIGLSIVKSIVERHNG